MQFALNRGPVVQRCARWQRADMVLSSSFGSRLGEPEATKFYNATMGHNPSRYKLKALSADAQHAVDERKARSVCSVWWSLDEKVGCRFFTDDERAFIVYQNFGGGQNHHAR